MCCVCLCVYVYSCGRSRQDATLGSTQPHATKKWRKINHLLARRTFPTHWRQTFIFVFVSARLCSRAQNGRSRVNIHFFANFGNCHDQNLPAKKISFLHHMKSEYRGWIYRNTCSGPMILWKRRKFDPKNGQPFTHKGSSWMHDMVGQHPIPIMIRRVRGQATRRKTELPNKSLTCFLQHDLLLANEMKGSISCPNYHSNLHSETAHQILSFGKNYQTHPPVYGCSRERG